MYLTLYVNKSKIFNLMATFTFQREDHPELTFDDVFLQTYNPFESEVLASITESEQQELAALSPSDRFHRMLRLAEKYNVGKPMSRDTFDLTPEGGLATIPLVIANMNNVVGRRMAEAIARVGGIAAIPQDRSDDEMRQIVEYLKTRHPVYETPVEVEGTTKVHELRRLLQKRGHDVAVVKSGNGVVGVVSLSDILSTANEDSEIQSFVRSDVVTAQDGITPFDALLLMEKERVQFLPIIGQGDTLVGVLTKIGAALQLRYKPNLNPEGGLNAMYTIGAFNKNPIDRARFLFEQGVTNIVIDTAHFDQGITPFLTIEKVREEAVKRNVDARIACGNVITRSACRSIMLAGANIVKGGIGPGAMCSTRMVTGVGRPQVSMIIECADETRKAGGLFIADGGVKHPRDMSLALATGAHYVMVGSLFAGTYESPPDLERDKEGLYKINRGMAASTSSRMRTNSTPRHDPLLVFRDVLGHRSEGSEGSKVYLKPGRELAGMLAHSLMEGPTSTGTYLGAKNIQELFERAVISLQTPSGFNEGRPVEKL